MIKNMFTRLITVLLIGFLPGITFAGAITKLGEWGSGYYGPVFVQGNYAYCTAGSAGLDIIDISNPAKPKKAGSYATEGEIWDILVSGNYAYVSAKSRGLHVLNIANPAKPTLLGTWVSDKTVGDVIIKGQYAYIANGEAGLTVLDISNPATITQVGNVDIEGYITSIFINGNYAYVLVSVSVRSYEISKLCIFDISSPASPALRGERQFWSCYALDIYVKNQYAYIVDYVNGINIVDISNPSDPVTVSYYITGVHGSKEIDIVGNYAYVAAGENGLQVLDISAPTAPVGVGNYNTAGDSWGIFVTGNYAYLGDTGGGLQIIDIAAPANPTLAGSYDYAVSSLHNVCLYGNYLYAAGGPDGLLIFDISNPTRPTLAGSYDTPGMAESVFIRDNLAYVADNENGLVLFDISNPAAPVFKGRCQVPGSAYDVKVIGNYAFVLDWVAGALLVIDISNPAQPILKENRVTDCYSQRFNIDGTYAYIADIYGELKIISIAAPNNPYLLGTYKSPGKTDCVFVSGHYAYMGDQWEEELFVIDVTNPSQPECVATFDLPGGTEDLVAAGHYLYTANSYQGLGVVDISIPSDPVQVARYTGAKEAATMAVNGNYIYLSNGYKAGKLFVLKFDQSSTPARLKVNHTNLYFAAELSGSTTPAQFLTVNNIGTGTMDWSVSANKSWLEFSPAAGTDSGQVTVTANPTGLAAGTYTAELSISAPHAFNSPIEVAVQFRVYQSGKTAAPFGEFATPTNGATVSSSVPFTGWVLDDIGVESVQLFRESAQGLVYIGDAVFVEGARPDVEQTYPTYPMNYKAGWGYMMLTNFLPNGNGVFTIQALATDREGNQVNLGSKTITVDNAHAVKPFGALDTPLQGGTAAGKGYVNFGWVLTPRPNTIPTDGSTIKVWVDGVCLGNPEYNKYRQDIAALFPDYANSSGAGGNFNFDTTQYSNGVHTIQWTARDDAGNSDGIGSRYFTILNTPNDTAASTTADAVKSRENLPPTLPASRDIRWNQHAMVVKGYVDESHPQPYDAGEDGTISLEINELDRLEIQLSENSGGNWWGYQLVGNTMRPLPIGSSLDVEKGIFRWQPGAGFLGQYRLIFVERNQQGNILSASKFVVNIIPKY